jgi:hypothetical protein
MSNDAETVTDEIEAAIQDLNRAAMAVGHASASEPSYNAARNAEIARNNLRRLIRVALDDRDEKIRRLTEDEAD